MSTPTAPSSAAPDPTHGANPPTSGRPARRRWLVPVLVTVVAVAVVLAALVATGILPLSHSSNSGPGATPTFQGAASEAQPSANAQPHGPWSPAAGVGIRLPLALTLPTVNITQYLSDLNAAVGCEVSLLGSPPTQEVLDGTPGSASPGAAAFWVVMFVNGTGGALGVMVNGGVATPLFSVTGNSTCREYLDALAPFPAGSPDSPAIVAAVNASGGSTFLSEHPNATEVFVGLSAVIIQPTWEVVYTTCSPTVVPGVTGYEYNATVSGTTVQHHASGVVSCSVPANVTLGAPIPGGARGPADASPVPPAVGKAI